MAPWNGDFTTAWIGHEDFADWLVRLMQPKVIVELGVWDGFSLIAWARPAIGQVYGIDWFKGDPQAGIKNPDEMERKCVQNILNSGCPNIHLLRSSFDDGAKSWKGPIDILHIDGQHTYAAVSHDFATWSPFVRKGGVIVMHDTQSFPNDVGRFFREIQSPKCEFKHAHGLGVILKP
jgi:predicted O-methyltransferase YrrM